MARECEINDIRKQRDFKGISFSEFKKSDVKKELLLNLYKSKIESVCYWTGELICAGHYSDIWDIIIQFYTQHIHIGHPQLIVYLELRIRNFKEIVRNGYADQELSLRNNDKIRKLFCEIMCILCESKKSHSYAVVKIKQDDFDLTYMTERFKAPSIEWADAIYYPDDPKELFIVINELAYNLSSAGKNCVTACYWMEWILEFDSKCRLKKEKCSCERRTYAKVNTSYQIDIVWMIWDAIIHTGSTHDKLTQRILQCALDLFCLKYTSGCNKKRKSLFYFAIAILTEPYVIEPDISKDKEKLKLIIQNIDKIYKQIKKNEHAPDTEYLFHNTSFNNLQQTIHKLEQMNNLGAEYIPRTNIDPT